MDDFEKIEKLRERANVSYEEAKEALQAANGDLLDAMIYLEKAGKVDTPEKSMHSTEEETTACYSVAEAISDAKERNEEPTSEKWKRFFRAIGHALINNHLVVKHHNEQVLDLPLWIVLCILCFSWWVMLVLIVVSLFFDWHYKIEGPNNMKVVNDAMDMASTSAGKLREEMEK